MIRRMRKTFSNRSGNDMKNRNFGSQVMWIRREEALGKNITLCVNHTLVLFPDVEIHEVELAHERACELCACATTMDAIRLTASFVRRAL